MINSNTVIAISNANLKNNVTMSISHVYSHLEQVKKTVHHVVNITITEARLFAIRYRINQTILIPNTSHIVVIMDQNFRASQTLERCVLFQWSNHIRSRKMSFASPSYMTMLRNRGGSCSYKPDPVDLGCPKVHQPVLFVWLVLMCEMSWLEICYDWCPFQTLQVHFWTDAVDRWASTSLKSFVVKILFRMKNLIPTFVVFTLVLSLLWSTPPMQNGHIPHQHTVNPFEL